MRIRTELSIALVGCSLVGIALTTVFQARSFIADQESYIHDLHSVLATARIRQLDDRMQQIHQDLSDRLSLEASALESWLKAKYGVSRVEIWKGNALVSTYPESSGVTSPPVMPEGQKEISVTPRGTLRWTGTLRGKTIVLDLASAWTSELLTTGQGARALLLSPEVSTITDAYPSPVENPALAPLYVGTPGILVIRRYVGVDKKTYLGTFARLGNNHPTLILLSTPATVAGEVVARSFRQSAWLAITCILFCSAFGLWFSRRFSKPIDELAEKSSEVAKGNFSVQAEAGNDWRNEVGVLVRSFNRMSTDLESLTIRNRRSERLSALGQFSAGIAYEIKNPLAGILANIQVATMFLTPELKVPPEVSASLEVAVAETKRANRIVQGLMQFARQDKAPERVLDLGTLVKNSLSSMRPLIDASRATLDSQVSGEPIPCRMDGDQIHQVILNLVQNSLHAMQGREKPSLRITLRQDGEWYYLAIEDTGQGMSREMKEHLFEPFFTTKKFGEGTGLGLSVSHGIIENHGGKISVESVEGVGTTFTLQFPLPSVEEIGRAA